MLNILSPSDNFPRSIIFPPPLSGQNSTNPRMVDNFPPFEFLLTVSQNPRKTDNHRQFRFVYGHAKRTFYGMFLLSIVQNVKTHKIGSRCTCYGGVLSSPHCDLYPLTTFFPVCLKSIVKNLGGPRMVDNSPPPSPPALRGGGKIIIRGEYN